MWYPNEGAWEFQGGGNDEPHYIWQPESSNELGGDPVELKLKPPIKGNFLAVLVSLNLEEGLVGQGPRGHAGWCWCLRHTVGLVL